MKNTKRIEVTNEFIDNKSRNYPFHVITTTTVVIINAYKIGHKKNDECSEIISNSSDH